MSSSNWIGLHGVVTTMFTRMTIQELLIKNDHQIIIIFVRKNYQLVSLFKDELPRSHSQVRLQGSKCLKRVTFRRGKVTF